MKLPQNYAVGYLLWFFSLGLTLLAILIGRVFLSALFSLTDANYWVLSFIDRAGILILGTIGLALTLFLEFYYRQGVERRLLWRRFRKVTVVQLGIIVVTAVLPALAA